MSATDRGLIVNLKKKIERFTKKSVKNSMDLNYYSKIICCGRKLSTFDL